MQRLSPIEAAAVTTIAEGSILHVRAERLPGRRVPKRAALPAVDCSVGPAAHGGYQVVDYSQIKSGREEHFDSAEAAVHEVRRMLGWDRLRALSHALVKVHGPVEKQPSLFEENARTVARGERLRGAYGHKPGITGPLFGPSGTGTQGNTPK